MAHAGATGKYPSDQATTINPTRNTIQYPNTQNAASLNATPANRDNPIAKTAVAQTWKKLNASSTCRARLSGLNFPRKSDSEGRVAGSPETAIKSPVTMVPRTRIIPVRPTISSIFSNRTRALRTTLLINQSTNADQILPKSAEAQTLRAATIGRAPANIQFCTASGEESSVISPRLFVPTRPGPNSSRQTVEKQTSRVGVRQFARLLGPGPTSSKTSLGLTNIVINRVLSDAGFMVFVLVFPLKK